MSTSFNYIPSGNGVRVPLFYAEMDNSQASYFNQSLRTLLIGHKVSGSAKAVAGTPYLVATTSQAIDLYGQGSMLARMHELYRQSDPTGEVWCMAVVEPAAGAAASGTLTLAGTATVAGTLNLYIAGQRVSVAVNKNDAAATVATAINTAINAALDLPVTSAVATNTVTLTARWKGSSGNDITVLDSFRGTAGGESLPNGLGITYSGAQLSGGTGAPNLSPIITAMGDDAYDFVIHPFIDSASLDAFQTEYGDASGRWSWSRQVYGHCYTALRGTLSALVAAGDLRNDPHHTLAAMDSDCPHPNWEYAAAFGARNAVYIAADPARPTQTGELTGIMAPRAGKRFIWTERNSLLSHGIATSVVNVGTILVERAITTYQKNAFGQADPSYMDSETLHTCAYILRYLRQAITSKYARHKLANDGTRYGAGNAVVTPSVIRGELLAAYAVMEDLGIVENVEIFNQYLVVERDSVNPNRVNVLFPPDLVNQLRVLAVLNQFRLQFPAQAAA